MAPMVEPIYVGFILYGFTLLGVVIGFVMGCFYLGGEKKKKSVRSGNIGKGMIWKK